MKPICSKCLNRTNCGLWQNVLKPDFSVRSCRFYKEPVQIDMLDPSFNISAEKLKEEQNAARSTAV